MKSTVLLAVMLLLSLAVLACDAKTKAGTQCTRKAVHNGFCKQHDPETVKCAGKTKTGQPCSLLPAKGSTFCWRHGAKVS